MCMQVLLLFLVLLLFQGFELYHKNAKQQPKSKSKEGNTYTTCTHKNTRKQFVGNIN